MANRLAKETSPYLLQHKNNPVDWYPWGSEALDRARTENKPILLSIGYSACHWCHVMEHESFLNPQIAELMNKNFVNIKVDREERPDLDHVYQNVAQAMTRSGGWPLTVFLTPDLKPFYGGTYFPPEDKFGRPGFPKVLSALAQAFQHELASVHENAEKLTDFIASLEAVPPSDGKSEKVGAEELKKAAEEIISRVDWKAGGMGGAPKFPNPMVFSFLWRLGLSADFEKARDAALVTLTRMASGGIYDHLGGGFHRYSVDDSWSVPHFEKMLYDNALLLKLYSEVLLTGDGQVGEQDRDLYLRILVETKDYIFREMTSPDGVFYSAQDADSEGEEGKFFVWDPKELASSLTGDELRTFALRYGVTETGNFENGRTVLAAVRSLAEVAQLSGLLEADVAQHLKTAQRKLMEVRDQRIHPGLDDKVLTSWNGLMMSGLAWTAEALRKFGQEEEAKKIHEAAAKAFSFLTQKVTYDQDRLLSTFQGGQGKLNGYLDDYAFMAMAALDLSRFTQSPTEAKEYLSFSQRWINTILKHFKDSEGTGYFFTSDDHEKLIQRPKSIFDQAIPSGTAVALECMVALAELDLDNQGTRYDEEVQKQLTALFKVAERSPFGMGEFLGMSLLRASGPITVSGPQAALLCGHPHVFQKPEMGAVPKGILVCHRKTCSLPLENVESASEAVSVRMQSAL